MTTEEAAERCNVHPSTIHRWIRTGLLNPIGRIKATYDLDPAEVEKIANNPPVIGRPKRETT